MSWIEAQVERVVQETPIDRTLVFALPPEAPFDYAPGQYVTVRIPSEDPPRERPYTLSGAPGGPARITVRGQGAWGQAVYGLTEGTPVELKAPEGTFVLDAPDDHTLVLVGGGSGITPFRCFVEHLVRQGHDAPVVVVQSTRDATHLLYGEEFRAWATQHPWLSYDPTLTDDGDTPDWADGRGRIDEARLRAWTTDPARTTLFACGPTALVDECLAAGEALGIPPTHRRREAW